ncbi:MAG: sigma-70 family RNA polymerase sigma factor [Dehalococcoidia bacterium]
MEAHAHNAPAGEEAGAGSDAAEEALVERARQLDDAAWATIYQRHAEQVYAYIYYRLGDPHTAEDLAADVFVKAVAGIRGYSYRGTPLLAWLYRIAHNVTVDYRKSAAKRSQRTATEDLDTIEAARDVLRERDERSDMLTAIRGLTAEQQQVVLLRFYSGMSNAQVARVMGKPEGAVKALQARAVRSLRRILEGGASGKAPE